MPLPPPAASALLSAAAALLPPSAPRVPLVVERLALATEWMECLRPVAVKVEAEPPAAAAGLATIRLSPTALSFSDEPSSILHVALSCVGREFPLGRLLVALALPAADADAAASAIIAAVGEGGAAAS